MQVTIWHNPRCGTSRSVLAALRGAGIEPQVRDYLAGPPDGRALRAVLAKAGIAARDLLRRKEPLAAELGLTGTAEAGDEGRILAAMAAHPVLIERPVVIAGDLAVLCRPAERVAAILEAAARA